MMSMRRKVCVGAVLLLSALGCGSAQSCASAELVTPAASSSGATLDSQAGRVPQANNGAVASPVSLQGTTSVQRSAPSGTSNRSIIRRAELVVRVEDVEKGERKVGGLVSQMGGYVDSATSTDLSSDHPSMSLTLRVPVGQFDGALSQFEALGVRLSKTVNSEDVTGQIVDLDARLRTLSATEETYRSLLRETHQLQNVIELQDKLTEVRSNIESMTAQRKALSGLATLSTITLRLEQSAVPAQAPKDPNWLAQTWGEATSKLGDLGRTFASFGIWLAVFSPLWLPVLWLVKRLITSSKPSSQVSPPPVVPH